LPTTIRETETLVLGCCYQPLVPNSRSHSVGPAAVLPPPATRGHLSILVLDLPYCCALAQPRGQEETDTVLDLCCCSPPPATRRHFSVSEAACQLPGRLLFAQQEDQQQQQQQQHQHQHQHQQQWTTTLIQGLSELRADHQRRRCQEELLFALRSRRTSSSSRSRSSRTSGPPL
jgi:hypothetical protein